MPILFENDGSLDVDGAMVFGISAKESANPFGYFGTGLKYAIAVCLREGCMVEIYTGGHRYRFESRDIKFRNQDFSAVAVNDKLLGFTTELGKNWKLWQAFREFYCNCHDEPNPRCVEIQDVDIPLMLGAPNKTHVVVYGRVFADVYSKREEFILATTPEVKFTTFELHATNGATPAVFYNGIKVATFEEPFGFHINSTASLPLTEDRTMSGWWTLKRRIAEVVLRCNDLAALITLLRISSNTLVTHFLDTINWDDLTPQDYNIEERYRYLLEAYEELATDPKVRLPQRFSALIAKINPVLVNGGDIEPSKMQASMLKTARKFLKAYDFDVDKYPVRIRKLPNTQMGVARRSTKEILINELTFKKGQREVTLTLMEEYIHLDTGFDDNTREMQNYLFDVIINQMEELYALRGTQE